MRLKTILKIALACAVLPLTVIFADEINFAEYASKRGCESIPFGQRRNACKGLQAQKNKHCKTPIQCEYSKLKRLIKDYKDLKKKLDDGKISDKDRPGKERDLRDLEKEINGRIKAAEKSLPIATACVNSRNAVQTMFERTIPLVKKARDNALRERQKLLDKLEDAEDERDDIKKERDREKDRDKKRKLQKDFDNAVKDVRKVEKELKEFNDDYGKDIKKEANKITQRFKDGKRIHEQAVTNDKERRDNCKNASEEEI